MVRSGSYVLSLLQMPSASPCRRLGWRPLASAPATPSMSSASSPHDAAAFCDRWRRTACARPCRSLRIQQSDGAHASRRGDALRVPLHHPSSALIVISHLWRTDHASPAQCAFSVARGRARGMRLYSTVSMRSIYSPQYTQSQERVLCSYVLSSNPYESNRATSQIPVE